MINITLPDNSVRQVEKGTSAMDVARSISEGLARNVLAAKFNDKVIDANLPILEDGKLQLLTWNDQEGKAAMWHSSAHLMAEAIEILYPGAKFGIGPDIENGFYYDIDLGEEKTSEKDLKDFQKKMKKIISQNLDFSIEEISKKAALEKFSGNEYKKELIEKISQSEEKITIYKTGEIFEDLCEGSHVENTSEINVKAFKLTKVAGAY